MSDLATTAALTAQTAEHVLATGDVSLLSVQQKVELYLATCRSLGVNPLSRPFRFLRFQGTEQMYATRDLADQLRHRDKISIEIVSRVVDAGVYTVTARATTPDGRRDEDCGAVTIERLVGDARANAQMRATTKAKRRVTLSICGLGFIDESELDNMRGVQTWEHDAEPQRTVVVVERTEETQQPKLTWQQLLDQIDKTVHDAATGEEIDHLLNSPRVKAAEDAARGQTKAQLDKILADARARQAELDEAAEGEIPWDSKEAAAAPA